MKMDMGNINIKDILGKLSVLKSNVSLLASIGIALIAGLLFIPAKLLSSSLKENVRNTSVRMGNQVKSEIRTAGPKDQWKEIAKREAVYENDANQVAILAIQSTQRELLSYGIFPESNDLSSGIFKVFGDRYQSGIDDLLNRINSNDCPTEAELSQGMANASATSAGSERGVPRPYSTPSRSPYSTPSRSPYSAPSRSPYSRPARGPYSVSGPSSYVVPGGGTKRVESTIRDEICLSRAKAISVYANPLDLAGYEFWGQYKYDVRREDAIQDCWYYQLGYWVIEDVLSSIGSMNSGSVNVLTSPVKRLMSVGFGQSGVGGGGGPRSRSSVSSPYGSGRTSTASLAGGGAPSYVTVEQPGLAADSCTGRMSNDDIDVVHFNVSMVVGVKSVLPFIKELCGAKQHKFKGFFDEQPQAQVFSHNQITVLESKFVAVDRSNAFHSLYRYGQDAVVELDLVCEYVLKKKAYDMIKPNEVKGEPEPAGQPTGQGYNY